jgi:arylsulfatase I/J
MLSLRQMAIAAMAAALLGPAIGAGANRPHIIYILANDLGWKDVGYHGGKPETPNLDALAATGARLEKFYTLPNSTPTRAALLTGRYPMRYGLQMLSILPWSSYGLPVQERLLPQALQSAGYRTAAFGEWRLGHAGKDFWPTRRGFDHFYGSLAGTADHFRKSKGAGEPDWWRGEYRLAEDGYDTDLIAAEASGYLSKHDPKQPLFMYVAFPAPAAPLQAPREYLERYPDTVQEARRTYYAMVSAVDDGVGAIVAALEARGMRDDTLIVFHSDNGGAVRNKYETGDGDVPGKVADNGPFHNGAGALHEGGVRVVALASWPPRIKPGIVAERIHVTDMYPTLLRLAGAALDRDAQVKPIDGMDAWPVIAEGKLSARQEMLINVEEFRGAVLVGNWKLIAYAPLPAKYELYNVHDDPSEEDNRADREPQRLQQLLGRLNDYAWEMVPSLYLQDLAKARTHDTPIYWGENPVRP